MAEVVSLQCVGNKTTNSSNNIAETTPCAECKSVREFARSDQNTEELAISLRRLIEARRERASL
jgi:hypothetical protein